MSDEAKSVDGQRDEPRGWSMRMQAISMEEPGTLVERLTGAILGCGGWVVSRGASERGLLHLLFEFERDACIDMYSVLVASGVELSRSSHLRFTELCHCTRFRRFGRGEEIVCIELEIQTFRADLSMAVAHAA